MGCGEVAYKNDSFIIPAVEVAKDADATIILVGLDLQFEEESLERVDFYLPSYQTQLIKQEAYLSKGIMSTGGGLDISFPKENENIIAILWAGYPGEERGIAIGDIVPELKFRRYTTYYMV